ncbi:MAG: CRISPR-associated endonuclease Cas1 [Spirosomataceae bacterium]
MHLVLDTKGINLKVRKGCFHLQTDKHERLIGPQKLTSISITAQCWISSSAIRLAIQNKIPIYFHDGLGSIEGRLWSASFGHLATNRRQQVLFALDLRSTAWVIELFEHKTNEQIENLNYLKSRKIAHSKSIDEIILKMKTVLADFIQFADKPLTECSASLMGKEGTLARYYWRAVSEAMPDEFRFEDRNRRPAHDPFNAALNYLYGILYGHIENALFVVGLDPYLGLLHADEYNQPTLAFDLIEPFRPWIDRMLMQAILRNEVKPNFFEPKNNGVWLSRAGKQYFIPLFDKFMNEKTIFCDKMLKRTSHIYRFAFELSKTLTNFETKP